MAQDSIPALDFADSRAGGARQDALVQALGSALEDLGFAALANLRSRRARALAPAEAW